MRTAVKAAVNEWSVPKEGLGIGQLENHLGYFLRRLQIWVFQDFIQTLRPMKVRPAQYSVLLVIEANPGRSQAAIAHTLSIERARLARLLHVLERRKWISQARIGERRALALTLSDEGRRKGRWPRSKVLPNSTRRSWPRSSDIDGGSSFSICCASSADSRHSTS